MFRKKIKQDIIKDYICILSASNFCDYCCRNFDFTPLETTEIKDIDSYAQQLFETYRKLMFKLGLMDLSIAILDKEFILNIDRKTNSSVLNHNTITNKIKEFSSKLKQIGTNLKFKLDKLGLNKYELGYLKIDKLTNF